MYCNDVSVLHTEVMTDNTVHPSTSIIKIIIGQHNENRVLSLFALHKDGIAAEQL